MTSEKANKSRGMVKTRSEPSLATIADLAGVSMMTVSRVLRGTGRVSVATRERVTRIAR